MNTTTMMSEHELPAEEFMRKPPGNSVKKSRSFAAIDNPTLSPAYDPSLSPSPVPDWGIAREDPSDQPEYTAQVRGARAAYAVMAPSMGPGRLSALPPHPSDDLQDFDCWLLDNEVAHEHENSSRCRDWLAGDFDDHPPEVSSKKRRLERVACGDFDEGLDFSTPLPLEFDLDHALVDAGPGELHNMDADMHRDIHVGVQPRYHPDLSCSYHEEDEVHLHAMQVPMRMPLPRRHHHHASRSQNHIGAHHCHGMNTSEFVQEMDRYVAVNHETMAHGRSPAGRGHVASSHMSPSHVQARRVARHAPHPRTYSGQYMNGYVSSVNVPVGETPVYYCRAYARPHQYHCMNPANLPTARIRKAYHLSPAVAERQLSHPSPYYMRPDNELFHRHAFFQADPSGMSVADEPLLPMASIDISPQRDGTGCTGSAEMESPSFPTLKLSSIDGVVKSTPACALDDKSSLQEDLVVVAEPSNVSTAVTLQAPGSPQEASEQEDEIVVHFSRRKHTYLAIDEDANWLSEFQSFVRLEFLEIFRANLEDVKFRNTSRKVVHKQLGIRCRFCAHVHPGSRARRSSAYPSSTAQIYQSFNMMIRDHFPRCEHVPKKSMEMFHKLKGRNNQGAADSKHFWSYAAEKLGMVDSDLGIYMDEDTREAARFKSPFSTTQSILASASDPPVLLVMTEDRPLVTPFMLELMSRVQRVHLLDCECRSTRKNLKVGLPGFGCRYCCKVGRLGFSRIFPTKRKGLPDKANDMYDHMRRCTLCPPEVKKRLDSLRPKPEEVNSSTEKLFFDRVWARLYGGALPQGSITVLP